MITITKSLEVSIRQVKYLKYEGEVEIRAMSFDDWCRSPLTEDVSDDRLRAEYDDYIDEQVDEESDRQWRALDDSWAAERYLSGELYCAEDEFEVDDIDIG